MRQSSAFQTSWVGAGCSWNTRRISVPRRRNRPSISGCARRAARSSAGLVSDCKAPVSTLAQQAMRARAAARAHSHSAEGFRCRIGGLMLLRPAGCVGRAGRDRAGGPVRPSDTDAPPARDPRVVRQYCGSTRSRPLGHALGVSRRGHDSVPASLSSPGCPAGCFPSSRPVSGVKAGAPCRAGRRLLGRDLGPGSSGPPSLSRS